MIVPVVLSGGAGTRLWPVSRAGHPKPFMKLPDGQSLLVKTFIRAASLARGGDIVTVTNRDYFFSSKDELEVAQLGPQQGHVFLLEPEGRNTAPAIAMAALWVGEKHGDDTVMLVMAADHLIQDPTAFAIAVRHADALARAGRLVTFGAKPDRPDTGFGYIACGHTIAGTGGYAVDRFTEKPSAGKAAEFLAAGSYYWNCGIFAFTAGTVLNQLGQHAPDVLAHATRCWAASISKTTLGAAMLELDVASFAEIPAISIDYALMEKSSNVAVVPGSFGWSDIGSWTALSNLVDPDQDGNRSIGNPVMIDAKNNFIQSEDRIVAVLGVENLLIIDTPDALLVANRASAQDVKEIVDTLKARNHDSYKLHKTVFRPWGTYTVLEDAASFKIKRIMVKPGASLSLQMHHHRSEHWVVVSGLAKVVNGDQDLYVNTNESTYIPAGHRHRLENPGVLDLVLIEVQSGEYLGEDDIVRFEDRYGRA